MDTSHDIINCALCGCRVRYMYSWNNMIVCEDCFVNTGADMASTLRRRIANCEFQLDQMARDQVRLKQMVNDYRVELRGLEEN